MSDREIRLETEVPGTPEQVWEAIATGPGIGTWFVPAEIDGREGGEVSFDFGEGFGKETGVLTAWEPPHRVAYESPAGGEQRLAYEWLVEARSGGTCVVRLVNSGFGEGDDWDAQYDGMTSGWGLFLDCLRLSVTHFAGQPCTALRVHTQAAGANAEVWAALAGGLGLPVDAAPGTQLASAPGAPQLAGTVERFTGWGYVLRLEAPAPGYGFVVAEPSSGGNMLSAYLYLHDIAPAAAEREQAAWQAWFEARYPAEKAAAGAT
jgi:uncharacterized protein YndB with AHSA1/START domain